MPRVISLDDWRHLIVRSCIHPTSTSHCFFLLAYWRRELLTIQNPTVILFLQGVYERAVKVMDLSTATSARWAIDRLRRIPVILRRRYTPDQAAQCIQGMYRKRKAREYVRSLAATIYQQMIDPTTGMSYFYNVRSGTTSWSLPRFVS